jgi:hypothetical protein
MSIFRTCVFDDGPHIVTLTTLRSRLVCKVTRSQSFARLFARPRRLCRKLAKRFRTFRAQMAFFGDGTIFGIVQPTDEAR